MITFRDVRLAIEGRDVLRGVSFRITPGEAVCVTGPSRTERSLLHHLLLGVRAPDAGVVAVDGVTLRSLSPRLLQIYRRAIGFLPSDDDLLLEDSVAANVALPLLACGAPRDDVDRRIAELLHLFRLTQHAGAAAASLRGSERRCVALARALANSPRILLLDDPLANLTPDIVTLILSVLCDVNASGTTLFLTSPALPTGSLHWRELRLREGRIEEAEAPPPLLPSRPSMMAKTSIARKASRIRITPIFVER